MPAGAPRRIADAVGDLIPLDTLTIYEADEAKQVLKPVLVRDVRWAASPGAPRDAEDDGPLRTSRCSAGSA